MPIKGGKRFEMSKVKERFKDISLKILDTLLNKTLKGYLRGNTIFTP